MILGSRSGSLWSWSHLIYIWIFICIQNIISGLLTFKCILETTNNLTKNKLRSSNDFSYSSFECVFSLRMQTEWINSMTAFWTEKCNAGCLDIWYQGKVAFYCVHTSSRKTSDKLLTATYAHILLWTYQSLWSSCFCFMMYSSKVV